MIEEWLDVEGYEGLYQVSNLGNVKSLERDFFINYGNGYYRKSPERLLTQTLHHSGYLIVGLTKDQKTTNVYVHRLVLEAFVKNDDPENKTITNHKDEIKSNNKASNLEWCDYQYNNAHGTRTERAIKKTSKPVVGKHIETGKVLRFKSAASAGRSGYGFRAQSVARAARGERKTYMDYKWTYIEQGEGVRFR